MSRPPLQWNFNPDNRYHDMSRRASDDESQRLPALPSHPPSSTQEPPRFLFPDSQGYDPTIMNSSHPRYGPQGKAWDSGSEQVYTFSAGSNGPLPYYGGQRPSFSKSVEYVGTPGSSYDASCRSRGSIGSGGRLNDIDSHSSSTTFPSPVHSDKGMPLYPNIPIPKQQQQVQHQQRHVPSGVPMGFEKILNHSPVPSPPSRRPSASSRYHLHIRQQPSAARACGAGDRDRRPVDPPPIVQMLLSDFDPKSGQDTDILQDPRFTVGCVLVPINSSKPDGEHIIREDRQRSEGNAPGQSTPLLSGKAFVSPFHVDADPDPSTAPTHPSSEPYVTPTVRNPATIARSNQPATFYIFSDLSVRTAGLYRFQFRLMNWGSVEDTGQSMPILADAWSEPFRVYPAKDFPGMQDSSSLTEGLKGLGFVELKTRGKGKGKGRRPR